MQLAASGAKVAGKLKCCGTIPVLKISTDRQRGPYQHVRSLCTIGGPLTHEFLITAPIILTPRPLLHTKPPAELEGLTIGRRFKAISPPNIFTTPDIFPPEEKGGGHAAQVPPVLLQAFQNPDVERACSHDQDVYS